MTRRWLILAAFVLLTPAAHAEWSITYGSGQPPIVGYNLNGQRLTNNLGFIGSSPRDGAHLKKTPEKITLAFSRPVDPLESSIEVVDTFGQQMSTGELTGDDRNLTVTLPAELPPGRYGVRWKARCICDNADEMRESFHFTIQ